MSKEYIVAAIGVILIALTLRQDWAAELHSVIFG